jgi:Asp-tRNA(Asn)/Glu-tRNA(Gln) amidotransferase B subunit
MGGLTDMLFGSTGPRGGHRPGLAEAAATSAMRTAGSTVGREIVRGVLAANPAIVEKFRGGNEGVKGFLVGQVMKQSEGRANPQLAQKLVLEELAV